jgi:hypothetical protein
MKSVAGVPEGRLMRRICMMVAPSVLVGTYTSASHMWLPVVYSCNQRISVRGSVSEPSDMGSSVE